jgi:hypothetical protein
VGINRHIKPVSSWEFTFGWHEEPSILEFPFHINLPSRRIGLE